MIDKKEINIIPQLNISDIFVILSIDNEKEKFYDLFEKDGDLKIAGAFLIDLANFGKIQIINNKIYVKNPNPIGDQILDLAFNIIKSYKKPKSSRKFFYKISTKELFQELFELILNKLKIYGIIEYQKVIKHHKFIKYYFKGRFSKNFILKKIEVDIRNSILNELLNILLNDKEPDMKYYCLLCLLSVDEMYKVFIEKNNYKKVKERINILISNEIIIKIIQREINSRHANVPVVT
ncbi:MAG TPA: GPP34 family phosphoprotein [Candidatus Lokiarchaeia archaeon]